MNSQKIKASNTMNLWWLLAADISRKFRKEPLSSFDVPSDRGTITVDLNGSQYKISVEKV